MTIGQYLAAEIVKLGPFELLCDSNPDTGIPTVTWRIREGADPGYTLFDLADRLRSRGWQVPAYTLTGTASDIAVQRILVRLGVSRDMASLLWTTSGTPWLTSPSIRSPCPCQRRKPAGSTTCNAAPDRCFTTAVCGQFLQSRRTSVRGGGIRPEVGCRGSAGRDAVLFTPAHFGRLTEASAQ